jgi:serine/threonine protein phosphatase PrpC
MATTSLDPLRRVLVTLRASAAAMRRPQADGQINDGVLISGRIFAVADGADGGTQSGAHALREVVRRLGPSPRPHALLMRNAFRGAHVSLWFRDERALTLQSTVTVAVWMNTLVVIGHVGDSRAYRIRRGQVLQLTSDQPEGAEGDACVVRLGLELRPPDPEILRVRVDAGDRLVLCTDGLWRHFGNDDLIDFSCLPAGLACAALCDRAPRYGEEASVVVVDFESR